MTLRRPLGRRPLQVVALIGAAATGCSKNDNIEPTPPPPPAGPPITSVSAIATTSETFWSPFDGTPSPNADKIYFTALTEDSAPAVFMVDAAGGAPTKLHSGDPLEAPFSLVTSVDGGTIYVADLSADAETETRGRIFAMPSGGGVPTSMTGSEGTRPRSLDLVQENGADVLYFTGLDDQGQPAVFRMEASGGSATVVHAGAPLSDPSGLAVANNGTIYVADSQAAIDGSGAVVRIENGTATVIAGEMALGFPAGIALELDGSALYVSGFQPEKATSMVYRVTLADNAVVTFDDGIAQNIESAGLHRAHQTNVYAWANADGKKSKPSGGAVYVLRGR